MVRGSTDDQEGNRYQCISIVKSRGTAYFPELHTAMYIIHIGMHTRILYTQLDEYLKQWNSIGRSGLMSCMLSYLCAMMIVVCALLACSSSMLCCTILSEAASSADVACNTVMMMLKWIG